jgi:hypothetical protein
MADGTDGTDFRFRQRVDVRYQERARAVQALGVVNLVRVALLLVLGSVFAFYGHARGESSALWSGHAVVDGAGLSALLSVIVLERFVRKHYDACLLSGFFALNAVCLLFAAAATISLLRRPTAERHSAWTVALVAEGTLALLCKSAMLWGWKIWSSLGQKKAQ